MKIAFNPMINGNISHSPSCKGKFKTTKSMKKFDTYLGKHRNMLGVSILILGTTLGILCGRLSYKILSTVANRHKVEAWDLEKADRISQLSGIKQRTIAYQEAADSIKTAHSFENTMNDIKSVIKEDPSKAYDIINRCTSDRTRDEAFRKVAASMRK